MLDYEIKTVEGRKVAYFKELNYCTEVNTDKVNGEYIEIPNVLNTDVPKYKPHRYDAYYNLAKYSFVGRIKDAVMSIRNGDGDVIIMTNWDPSHVNIDSVRHYLNGYTSQEIRNRSMLGFARCDFGYTIHIRSQSDFVDSIVLDNGDCKTYGTPKYFDSYNEAEEYIHMLDTDISEYIGSYGGYPDDFDELDRFYLDLCDKFGGSNRYNSTACKIASWIKRGRTSLNMSIQQDIR